MKKKDAVLFTWRAAITSEYGPPSPSTRLVLLTLSLHMDDQGKSCFPTIETLMKETGLSNRAVITHLRQAEQDGCFRKTSGVFKGQRWRHSVYEATIPAAALPVDKLSKVVKDVHHLMRLLKRS